MNIYYEWADLDHTTLITHFAQGWTFAEHEDCYFATKDLILEQPHIVNVIWDFSQVTTMPLHALTNFSAFDKRIGVPANFGLLIIATNPRFVDTMINVSCRTFANRRNRVLIAESAEMAYGLLMDRSERVAALP